MVRCLEITKLSGGTSLTFQQDEGFLHNIFSFQGEEDLLFGLFSMKKMVIIVVHMFHSVYHIILFVSLGPLLILLQLIFYLIKWRSKICLTES